MSDGKKPLVIYHGAGCCDGFTARWVFETHFGDTAEYIATKHGDPLPDVDRRDVYVVDFSWKRGQMLELAGRASHLVVLDHHASAERELDGFADDCERMGFDRTEIVFDLSKSGCRLAWQYLKAEAKAAGPLFDCPEPPVLVQYAEDADLWRWALPGSKAASAVIRSWPQAFDDWNRLQHHLAGQSHHPHRLWPNGGSMSWVYEGEAILRAERQQVRKAVENAVVMTIGGYRVRVVNTTVLQSDIGHELAKGFPFSATYFDDLQRGLRVWSFRSTDDGIDVGQLARKFGGGGHKHASGAQQEISDPVSAMATKGV